MVPHSVPQHTQGSPEFVTIPPVNWPLCPPYPGLCAGPQNVLALPIQVSPTAIYPHAATRVTFLKYTPHHVTFLAPAPPMAPHLCYRVHSHLLCDEVLLLQPPPLGLFPTYFALSHHLASHIQWTPLGLCTGCSLVLKSPSRLRELPFSPSKSQFKGHSEACLISPGSCSALL